MFERDRLLSFGNLLSMSQVRLKRGKVGEIAAKAPCLTAT